MDIGNAEKVLPNLKMPGKAVLIENSDHHMYFDNPDELFNCMSRDIDELPV
jgi:hypothetical protein